jgi:hypothetical protein
LEKPSDSLTEWQGKEYDYGVLSLFTHYFVDHYGINILIDSLKSESIGITSLNEALEKNLIKKDFAQIFNDWMIATVVNDCSVDLKYCYLDKNLKNFRISPTLNFLPLIGNSSLSVSNVTKNWSGNWQKFIGGNGDLKLEFSSLPTLNFQIPYIIYDKAGRYYVKFLQLDKDEKGSIDIKNFGSDYNSLIIIPSLQTKISGFDGVEYTYPYSFTVSITGQVQEEDQELIEKLLLQIESLKKQIEALKVSQGQSGNNNLSCSQINANLYVGVQNSSQIICLQEFLKSQGTDIYPEGYVTGNFGNLTKSAVIRFQEKYAVDILTPVGLTQGSGFVGSYTMSKINQLIAF